MEPGGDQPATREVARRVFLLSESLAALDPRYETGTVNSYLIVGEKRALLFDTGTGASGLAAEVRRLTSLPVTVLNSHSHWDHVGANRAFGEILIHAAEAGVLGHDVDLPGPPHHVAGSRATCAVADGDRLDLGGRVLRVIHTPGHSPGSVSLADDAAGLLFTADAAHEGTLWLFSDTTAGEPPSDPEQALRSVRRLAREAEAMAAAMAVAAPGQALAPIVLPGHERTPLEAVFLPRLEAALAQAIAIWRAGGGSPWYFSPGDPGPAARKLAVDGISFLLPLKESPRGD